MRTYLDANVLALTMSKFNDPLKRSDVAVEVDATVFGCDATFWGDGCGFDHGKTGAPLYDAPQVSQVPVGLVSTSKISSSLEPLMARTHPSFAEY